MVEIALCGALYRLYGGVERTRRSTGACARAIRPHQCKRHEHSTGLMIPGEFISKQGKLAIRPDAKRLSH